MENNFRIDYAQQDLAKAQAIEDYVRKGVAKDLLDVIEDLTNFDENGNEMTPTKVCTDALAFYIELLKDVITDDMTDEQVLACVEAFEEQSATVEVEPTAEERIAAALEFQNLNSLEG